MQASLDRDLLVIRRGGIEPSIRQGEDAREEPENLGEGKMEAGFCEDTPGENEEDPYDYFDDGKEPPGCDIGNGRVGRTRLGSFKELGGHSVVEENPATQNVSQTCGDEGNGVFEARAIVDG